ncbi:transcriptional activator of glycolytic enzymes-domain-containing protein [Pilaira anomala]|nr:transcriptional activator of glycolytic enzymes-domain-containing protein [Pilaira anomala]
MPENRGILNMVHPRGETLKKLCSVACSTVDYADPGIGSIQDGYNSEQMAQVADYYMKRGKKPDFEIYQPQPFVSLEFKDESATRCPVFVMMITGGKTNKEMNKLYSGVIRHKNVYTCAFGAVGLYLFHCFHIKGDAFPDFTINENWFKTKLTIGQKVDKAVSYNTRLTSIDDAFEDIGINSKKRPIQAVKLELLETQRIVPQINSRIELAEQIRSVCRPASEVNPALMEALKKIDKRLDNLTSTINQSSEGRVDSPVNPSSGILRREAEAEEEEDLINRSYKLKRDLTTVYALWKEWTIGMNEGQPSVYHLNETYGTKYRADAKERKYYSKCLIIINEIKRVTEEQDITLEEAVEVIENLRISLEG